MTPTTPLGFLIAYAIALTLMTLLLVIVFVGFEVSAGRVQILTIVSTATFVLFIWILFRTLVTWAGGLRAALKAEGSQGKLLAIGLGALPVLVTTFFWILLVSLGRV